jgi:hypothetical protein
MLQSWNQLCFHGGAYILASVLLPGYQALNTTDVTFWAAVWRVPSHHVHRTS